MPLQVLQKPAIFLNNLKGLWKYQVVIGDGLKSFFYRKISAKEREIIQQEIGMYQDSPDYRLFLVP